MLMPLFEDLDRRARCVAPRSSLRVPSAAGPGRGGLGSVLAVWVDGRIYPTTNPAARKGRNLTSRPSAALTARAPTMDIIIGGPIAWIDDPPSPPANR